MWAFLHTQVHRIVLQLSTHMLWHHTSVDIIYGKGRGSKGPNGDRTPIRSIDSWVLRPKPKVYEEAMNWAALPPFPSTCRIGYRVIDGPEELAQIVRSRFQKCLSWGFTTTCRSLICMTISGGRMGNSPSLPECLFRLGGLHFGGHQLRKRRTNAPKIVELRLQIVQHGQFANCRNYKCMLRSYKS